MKVDHFQVIGDGKKGECCPECVANWDGSDIYEYFLEAKFNPNHEKHNFYQGKTLDEIKDTASSYGWTELNPKRFRKIIGIDCYWDLDATEDELYDGISYWQCPECEVAWHRFNGNRTDKFIKASETDEFEELYRPNIIVRIRNKIYQTISVYLKL